MTTGTCIFNTGSDHGGTQVQCLQEIYDAPTTEMLGGTGMRPGWRCLELGAGGGSIARWMADRVTPGEVVAVDVDTSRLEVGADVRVVEHDIRDGLPVDAPFDIIHARLVLMHMPQRAKILEMLAEALSPGGWLVLGDFGPSLPAALTAPDCDTFLAFDRMVEVGHGVVGPTAGQSLDWGLECGAQMERYGLVDVHSRVHSFSFDGGDTGARYMHSLMRQVEQPLLDAGLTQEELDHGHSVLVDPRFRGWFYQFVGTRGRKPCGGSGPRH